MGFTVQDMLDMKLFQKANLLWGKGGIGQEIRGVTIIESPDIVRFISGGEVLLTGLNAFQNCSPEEFRSYIAELAKKKVSALVIKQGRTVDFLEEKMAVIQEYAQKTEIPVIEIPFEMPFREILNTIMEHIFSEEVIRLKYFKTTHDNFTALSLSFHSMENGVQRIVDILSKLIGNPVALFDQNLECQATTDTRIREFEIQPDAKEYSLDFYSNYKYRRQEITLEEKPEEKIGQYLVRLNVMYNARMYLVVTETEHPVNGMDFIAVENAVTALKQELFRQSSLADLEKKFQSDIMNNILNGKVHSIQELRRDSSLLGISMDASYRIIAFNLGYSSKQVDLNDTVKYTNILNNAIAIEFPNVKIQNDMDRVIVIQEVDPARKQEEYRHELKEIVMKIQKRVASTKKDLKVCAGVGRMIEGIEHIPSSFKEATDSLMFIDILGDENEDSQSKIMIFSDMGIFKLLCQLSDEKEMMEYVPESLQKLYHYKKQQRQDLILTLKTYLEHNQNLTKTAQDLYIHYKTAAYRIERISQITGIDFDNPNEVLSVRIGLVVCKMMENLKK